MPPLLSQKQALICLFFISNFHIHFITKWEKHQWEIVIVKVAIKLMATLKILYTYKHSNIQGNLKFPATHKLTHVSES